MRPDGTSRAAALAAVVLAVVATLWPSTASAFPWMVHHTYTGCAECHVDPSGGGVLTAYGRAQSEVLLRTHYKKLADDAYAAPGEDETRKGQIQDFLFGVKLPEMLQLQADLRGLLIPDPNNVRGILMQGDLRGAVEIGPVTISGSLGVVSEGARAAQITSNDSWNLVSREYWVGVTLPKGFLLRAGRMNLPFGIRTEHHILDVRQGTRTNTNDQQQLGVSLFYRSRRWRAEVMGIAGNYQLRPDAFRERGYSLYAAYSPAKSTEIGVSSLFTTSQADLETSLPHLRMAHGVFTRWAPIPQLALLGEVDALVDRDGKDAPFTGGLVSTLILDGEPVQGLHLQAIGEQCERVFGDGSPSSFTGTGAVQWFFLPHTDLRIDAGYGTIACTAGQKSSPFASLQLHLFL